ncbi:uncharacterized protein LOC127715797 [Mytilus californianus]|uniref:uncharacterized protein LOC127715797 n=1 Tax=Mytilus californianus TaxID=6549 RepID=UPI0022465AD5|nr:uncharacterized protein LOC127715797 [Mytilus californianus]
MEMEVNNNLNNPYAVEKIITINEPYNQVLLVTSPIDISLRTKVLSGRNNAAVMLNYPVNVLGTDNGFDFNDYDINTWFMYEIMFGDKNGTRITWRKWSSGGPGSQKSREISTMNCNEFTSFWIQWNDYGEIRIGEGEHVGEMELVEWQKHLDTEMPFRIYNVGIKSLSDLDVEWIIHLTDEINQIKIEAPIVMEKFLNTTKDILKRSLPLEMYGFNMDQEKSISFSVRSCRDVRLYLSTSTPDIPTRLAGTVLYEIQLIDFQVKVSKWEYENKYILMNKTLDVSNCFMNNSYGSFWISWMQNILTFGTGLNVGVNQFIEIPMGYSNMIQDIYVASLTHDSRLWIINRKEIPSYVGERNKYVMDFDLDGDYDEDCSMRIYDCGVPDFDNAYVHIPYRLITDNKYGRVHTVVCSENFTHSGSFVTRCLPTGKWSKEFQCLPNCKEPPQLRNTGSMHDKNRNYSTWSTYNYDCVTGSAMKGNGTIVCQDNGEWSDPLFECICPQPPRKLNTHYTTSDQDAEYRHGDAYRYECMTGYAMTGNSTITCLRNGQWSEPSFTCSDCKCPCKLPDLTEEDIQEMKDKIRRENLIDKKSVSKYRRKITSAPDNRFSAKAIGYVGVACLTTTGLVVVLIDAVSLVNTVSTVFQNIKGLFI